VERPLTPRIAVRRLEPRDLDAVAAIEAASRPWVAHWTPDAYLSSADKGMCAWVAENGGRVAGFILARYAGGEMEILNLAVARHARRLGTGRALVRAATGEGATRGAAQAFLEVRESNAAGLAFYASLGFAQAGRRPNYYSDPAEAALILTVPLPGRS